MNGDLNRRSFITGVGASAAGVAGVESALGKTAAQSSPDQARGKRTVYVSADGSDSADGRTPGSAWRTTARVNAAIADESLTRGDTVLLRSGDVFFGGLYSDPAGDEQSGRLTISSYGDGERPRVSGYKVCNMPEAWTRHSPDVWRIDLSEQSGAYTGNVASASVNVGFIKVDGTIRGDKKFDLQSLEDDWDFYSDESQYLYVWHSSNPSLAGDVRVAVQGTLVVPRNWTTVSGIEVIGTGSHGFAPGWTAPKENVLIEDNVIDEIGGSQLLPKVRYGNGIELGINAQDITIRENEISNTYDVGITFQGEQGDTAQGWRNVHATGNTIYNCTQSFEVWTRSATSPPDQGSGSGFVNCSFTDNDCHDAGYSWGMSERPDKKGKGTHLLFYQMELPTDLRITGNRFHRALQSYVSDFILLPAELVMDDNHIILDPGTKIEYQRPETIEQAAGWVAAREKEVNSMFVAPGLGVTYNGNKPVDDNKNPPDDPDGNAHYEDVNGDGEVS